VFFFKTDQFWRRVFEGDGNFDQIFDIYFSTHDELNLIKPLIFKYMILCAWNQCTNQNAQFLPKNDQIRVIIPNLQYASPIFFHNNYCMGFDVTMEIFWKRTPGCLNNANSKFLIFDRIFSSVFSRVYLKPKILSTKNCLALSDGKMYADSYALKTLNIRFVCDFRHGRN
jgi:hypothetical protein